MCSSYQKLPADLASLPLICSSRCTDHRPPTPAGLPVFVFALRLPTWQHGPGAGGKVPGLLLLLLRGKENVGDVTSLTPASSSVEWGQ